LSKAGGYEEGQWGYQALLAHNNQEAVRWLKDAISYRQNEKEYWHDLAVAYEGLGNNRAAVAAYERAANEGDLAAASYLATLYDGGIEGVARDEKQAVYWYRKAASGNDPDTLNNLAWAYATSRSPEIHNPTAALEYARKAVSLDHEPVAYHLDTLAEACYANGLYEEAVQTERQAIALAPVRYKHQIEDDLKKYEQALRNHKLQHNVPVRQVRSGLSKP
jgi:TPR repeat protein